MWKKTGIVAFALACGLLLLPGCADESAVQETETETTTTETVQTESYPAAEDGEVPPNAEELLVPSQDEIDDAMLHEAQDAYDQYMVDMMEQEDAQYPPYY